MTFRKIAILTMAAAAAALTAGPSVAADPAMEKAVKSRQAMMTLYSWNLGRLSAMAKGEAPYDAAAAQGAANSLMALTKHDASGLWPKGSDSTAMPGMTRAKAEAWATYPEIANKGTDLANAATQLSAVAGNGLDALKGGVGPVGKACGACHSAFREK